MNRILIKSAKFPFLLALGMMLILTGLLPINAHASDDSIVLDKFAVTVGSFFATTSSDLRLGVGNTGTDISFEDVLGLDSNNSLFRLSAEFRPWKRVQFGFGYFKLDRTATKTLDREIEFNGVVYPINVTVDAFRDTTVWGGSFTYWVSVRERTAFGLSFGLTAIGLDAGISANTPRLQTSASTDLPVALIGAEFRGAIAEPLRVRGRIEVLPKVTIDDVSGSVFNYYVELEYRFIKNVGVAVAYSGTNIDVDVEKREFFGNVNYDIQGVQLFARIAF